ESLLLQHEFHHRLRSYVSGRHGVVLRFVRLHQNGEELEAVIGLASFRRIGVQQRIDLRQSRLVLCFRSEDTRLREVQYGWHPASFCYNHLIVVRRSERPIGRPAVVFLVRQDMPDVYPAEVVPYVDDETVLVAADVEHHSSIAEEVRVAEILTYFVRSAVSLLPHDRGPGSQGLFRIGIPLPEVPET